MQRHEIRFAEHAVHVHEFRLQFFFDIQQVLAGCRYTGCAFEIRERGVQRLGRFVQNR